MTYLLDELVGLKRLNEFFVEFYATPEQKREYLKDYGNWKQTKTLEEFYETPCYITGDMIRWMLAKHPNVDWPYAPDDGMDTELRKAPFAQITFGPDSAHVLTFEKTKIPGKLGGMFFHSMANRFSLKRYKAIDKPLTFTVARTIGQEILQLGSGHPNIKEVTIRYMFSFDVFAYMDKVMYVKTRLKTFVKSKPVTIHTSTASEEKKTDQTTPTAKKGGDTLYIDVENDDSDSKSAPATETQPTWCAKLCGWLC